MVKYVVDDNGNKHTRKGTYNNIEETRSNRV